MGFGSLLSESLKNQVKGFGSGFQQGFFGTDYLKDYKHASKTFVKDGLALAPTNKFLFHVYFTLNTGQIPGLQRGRESATIGVLAKTAQLPSFTIDVEEMNQYNRKRYIQKKINYQPVTITLHDDGSDVVRSMWVNYYRYYYNDSSFNYDGLGSNTPSYNNRDIYENLRSVSEWGFNGSGPVGDSKPAFFKDIKIYTLNRGNFKSYTMINPIITAVQHDTHDVRASGDLMEHTLTFNYETVKYGRGKVGSQVKGFGDPAMYDTSSSPLRAGGTASLFGQGGILDAGESIMEDLSSGNILGAIRTGGTLRNTLRNVDTSQLISTDLATEAVSQGANFLSNIGSNQRSFGFPSVDSNNVNNGMQESFYVRSPARTNSNTFSTLSKSLSSIQRQFNSNDPSDTASIHKATQQGLAVLEDAELSTPLQPTLDNLQQNAQSASSSQLTHLVFDPKTGTPGDVTSNGQNVGE
jgi:hypothetical protein